MLGQELTQLPDVGVRSVSRGVCGAYADAEREAVSEAKDGLSVGSSRQGLEDCQGEEPVPRAG